MRTPTNHALQPTGWPFRCLVSHDFNTQLCSTARSRQRWLSFVSLDVAAMCYSRVFLAASAVLAVCAHAQDATPTPSVGDVLLHPSYITLTGHFAAPLGATAVERAIQSVGEQIDVKRAADTARSQIAPVWDLRIWRYLPADPAHTLNSPVASDDDLFFTPDYLKVSARQLDYQLKLSERASRDLSH